MEITDSVNHLVQVPKCSRLLCKLRVIQSNLKLPFARFLFLFVKNTDADQLLKSTKRWEDKIEKVNKETNRHINT